MLDNSSMSIESFERRFCWEGLRRVDYPGAVSMIIGIV